jgi:hypothetical protein
MAKQRIIEFKKSKKTGRWYWRMKGKNGEKMANSAPLKSRSWLYELMNDFKKIGFEIQWNGFK